MHLTWCSARIGEAYARFGSVPAWPYHAGPEFDDLYLAAHLAAPESTPLWGDDGIVVAARVCIFWGPSYTILQYQS